MDMVTKQYHLSNMGSYIGNLISDLKKTKKAKLLEKKSDSDGKD